MSSRPTSRTQVRTVVVVALALFLAFLISLPIRNYPLVRSYAVVTVMHTSVLLVEALTATLFFSQAAMIRSRALTTLATGYLFSALMLIPLALTYPHEFSEKGLLSAGLSSSVWLYFFWHSGLPIAVMLYANLKVTDATRPIRHGQVRRTIILCMTGCAVVVTLLTILAIVGEPWLPRLMTDAFTWRLPLTAYVAFVPLALNVGALATILRRDGSMLDLWLALGLWSWLIELALGMVATGRFTVGWYVGDAAGVLAGIFVLALLLWETNRLYARLALSITAQRREREGRSLTMNAVAAAMAHELKQPLTAIVANAGSGLATVQHTPPDISEASALFELIEQDGFRAADAVDSIRAMFAHRPSEKALADINELIRETAALMARELTMWRVKLDLALEEQTQCLSVDRVQMEHVFLNLMSNAIEAMASVTDRQRRLAIRSTANEAAVEITVADSGIGIDASHLDRVFDEFFTTKLQGTGMGLSLCRAIIDNHGGRIWLTANQPFGATFHVQLPYSRP